MIFPQNSGLVDGNIATPSRTWVLWPFTDIRDARFTFGNRFSMVHAAPGRPTKIGYRSDTGWLAYWSAGIVLIKRFQPAPDEPHPDLNANAQVYGCEDYVEVETLGPLVSLAPGESTVHQEAWTLHAVPDLLLDEDGLAETFGRIFSSLKDCLVDGDRPPPCLHPQKHTAGTRPCHSQSTGISS